jgi:hypothetical protein
MTVSGVLQHIWNHEGLPGLFRYCSLFNHTDYKWMLANMHVSMSIWEFLFVDYLVGNCLVGSTSYSVPLVLMCSPSLCSLACRGNTASVLRIVPYAAIHFGKSGDHMCTVRGHSGCKECLSSLTADQRQHIRYLCSRVASSCRPAVFTAALAFTSCRKVLQLIQQLPV